MDNINQITNNKNVMLKNILRIFFNRVLLKKKIWNNFYEKYKNYVKKKKSTSWLNYWGPSTFFHVFIHSKNKRQSIHQPMTRKVSHVDLQLFFFWLSACWPSTCVAKVSSVHIGSFFTYQKKSRSWPVN